MNELQKKVEQFCQQKKLETSLENRVLDLVSEVGEVAKEVLKSSCYGKKPLEISQDMGDELGDALFSLLCIANICKVDMSQSLINVLKKYGKRLKKTGSCGSAKTEQGERV